MVNSFTCGISHAFINKKPKPNASAAFTRFPTESHTVESLAAHIAAGGAFTMATFKQGKRGRANFAAAALVGLDLDNGVSVAATLEHPDIKQYAAIVYPTASSSPESPRTRVVFVLDAPIGNAGEFEAILSGLLAHFASLQPDPACSDAPRYFCGSTVPGIKKNEDARLPLALATSWIPAAPPAPVERKPRRITPLTGDSEYDTLAAALDAIPASTIDYRDWQRTMAGVVHTLGESAAAPLLERWTGHCSKRGEVEYKAGSFNNGYTGRRAGLGTVLYIARQFGYTPPKRRAGTPAPLPQAAPQAAPPRWFSAVPDGWRQALLQIDAAAALAYEVLTAALNSGQLDPDNVSLPALKNARDSYNFGLSDSTLTRGFSVLFELLFTPVEGIFFKSAYTNCKSVGISEKNSPRGRRAPTYRLLDLPTQRANLYRAAYIRLAESVYPAQNTAYSDAIAGDIVTLAGVETIEDEAALLAELNAKTAAALAKQAEPRAAARRKLGRRAAALKKSLQEITSAPLPPGWPLNNPREYRIAYLRGLKAAGMLKGTAKGYIAAILGISARVVNDYVRAAGIEIETDQQAIQRITSPENVTRQVMDYARQVQGRPLHVVIEGEFMPYSEAASGAIAPALAAGERVEVVYQTANKHIFIEDATPLERPTAAPPERVAPQSRPAAPPDLHIVEPRPLYGHDMEWLRGQLALRLKLDTGELAPHTASAGDLLELLLGRPLATRKNPQTSENMLKAGWRKRDIAADLAKWGIAS